MTLTMKEMWDRSEVDVNDCSNFEIIHHRFLCRQTTETITAIKDLILKEITPLDVIDSIATLLYNSMPQQIGIMPVISGEHVKSYYLCGKLDEYEVFIHVTHTSRDDNGPGSLTKDDDDNTFGLKVSKVRVTVSSHREVIKKIFSHLTSTFEEAKVSVVRWWYKADHGVASKEIYLEPVKTMLRPEFYPFMSDPQKYLTDYLQSSEAILLLAGPPGTGKTTLLRHLISDFNMHADIIYDEAIMDNDSIFQSFLFSKSNLMIIEDADRILMSRQDHDNSLMSRFLNVSDGIIKLPEKKMIFTSNVTDFKRNDEALLRAGRCFGTVHTRELTYQEACIAAKVAGLAPPKQGKECTLAELFNPDSGSKIRKAGWLE